MTLQQLEYIIALARHRQFAKAADACGVTQPTLSAMIQKLEEELGAKIFERRKQPVTPTPVGLIILERAEEILQRAQRLKEAVNEAQHSLKGTFSIGILPTIAPYLLPRFLPQLMQTYPDTDVRFIEMKTAEIKRALDQNEIDAGIVAELEDMDNFSAHTLFYEQFLAYIAESDPLAAKSSIKSADLKDEYLWLLDEGHCFRDQLVKFCQLKAASHSKKAYNLGSIETFMRLVEKGKGVTFIPELAMLQLDESRRPLVRPFAIPVPTRKIVLLTNKDFIRIALRDLIVEEVQKVVPRDMLTLHSTQKALF